MNMSSGLASAFAWSFLRRSLQRAMSWHALLEAVVYTQVTGYTRKVSQM